MPQLIEEPTQEGLDVPRLIGIAHRRRLAFLTALFCGWLFVWGASWLMHPHFRSSTLIMVQQPTISETSVTQDATGDIQLRLESMTQQIMSRTRLLEIINNFHLYGGSANLNNDQKVEQMRKDIDVELVRDSKKENITSFRIDYTAPDPHLAQAVTTELTNLFINENLETRQRETQGTTAFLQKQLDDASAALAVQEEKVQRFEAQHIGDLPSQQTSNVQILAGLQSQLQNEQDALNTAKQQGVYLQAMIQEERATQRGTIQASKVAGSGGEQTDLAVIDQQLEKMRAQLADLSSRYTDRYPDVLSLKNQIAKTEATRDRIVSAMKQKSAAPSQSDEFAGDPNAGAAARQLQSQLQGNQAEIKNRENSIIELKARINEYQGRLNSAPLAEQQLAELNRGYEQSKANYDDLLKKRDQSQMANSMEKMEQGERFIMLDPPLLPAKPYSPNHLKFCAIGLVAGLFLGFVAAAGLEVLDDRLHTEKEIKAILPMAVILEIPEILSTLDQENAQKKKAFLWATTAIVLSLIFAGAVFSYLHG